MSISVTALVEVDFFSSVALTTNPLILSIWNLFYGSLIVKTFADRERVVFWNWPLPVHFRKMAPFLIVELPIPFPCLPPPLPPKINVVFWTFKSFFYFRQHGFGGSEGTYGV